MNDRARMAAIAGLAVGFPALLCGLGCAPCGVLLAVLGLALAVFALSNGERAQRPLALMGLVLNVLSLVIAVANFALGAYGRQQGWLPSEVTFFSSGPADAGVEEDAGSDAGDAAPHHVQEDAQGERETAQDRQEVVLQDAGTPEEPPDKASNISPPGVSTDGHHDGAPRTSSQDEGSRDERQRDEGNRDARRRWPSPEQLRHLGTKPAD